MSRFNLLKTLVAAIALSVGGLGLAQTAAAGGYQDSYHDGYQDCYMKRVVSYEFRRIPYYDYLTQYDDCGHPYEVKVLRYRMIEVPVIRFVKVCH